jgi:hypothetical protein
MRQLIMDNQEAHITLGRRNRKETHTIITHNTEYPIGGIGFDVYCDWSTNNEGWTVKYY